MRIKNYNALISEMCMKMRVEKQFNPLNLIRYIYKNISVAARRLGWKRFAIYKPVPYDE